MKSLLDGVRSVIKNGAILFTVGVLLALTSPYIADALHISPAIAGHHDPLWTGAFFGAFGAFHAAMAPVFRFAFGDKEKAEEKAPEKTPEPQVVITLQQAEGLEAGKDTRWQDFTRAKSTEQPTPRL